MKGMSLSSGFSQYFFLFTSDKTKWFTKIRLDCEVAAVNEGFVAVFSTHSVA